MEIPCINKVILSYLTLKQEQKTFSLLLPMSVADETNPFKSRARNVHLFEGLLHQNLDSALLLLLCVRYIYLIGRFSM